MHDDDTRAASDPAAHPEPEHRSGWGESDTVASVRPSTPPWRKSQDAPPGGSSWNSNASGWPGRPSQHPSAPYGYQSAPAPAPEASRRRAKGWIAPLIIVLAAVVLLGLLFFFLHGRDPEPSPSGQGTVAGSAPTGGTTSAAASPSASSTTSTAPLPSGSTRCSQGTGESTLTATNAVITEGKLSCQFAGDVIAAVEQHVQGDPRATQFSLPGITSTVTDTTYFFNCSRTNHLTSCEAIGTSSKKLGVAVQDSVG